MSSSRHFLHSKLSTYGKKTMKRVFVQCSFEGNGKSYTQMDHFQDIKSA